VSFVVVVAIKEEVGARPVVIAAAATLFVTVGPGAISSRGAEQLVRATLTTMTLNA
jgi:hypothetical protein